tara:strand:- start:2642 stop:3226 length:585 start_codon:yes stop_codon:yes gene_type:complete
MLKIIPLVILPIYFLLFFLNVENLTQDSDQKRDFSDDEYVNSETVELEVKETFEEKISEEIVKEKEKISEEIVKEKEKISEEIVKEKEKISEKDGVKKDVLDKPDIVKDNISKKKTKEFYIQFGAFSNKKNAVQLRTKIEKKINEQYPSIKFSIVNDEKKNLFKLIVFSDSNELAENVCNYSKKRKIDCLVVKE